MKKAFHIASNPLPAGFRIIVELAEVRGVHLRRGAAKAFCRSKSPSLEWRREPRNRADENAIAIFGVYQGWLGRRTKQLGYVDRELAARLSEFDLQALQPRLHKTYLGHDGYVEITFQVIGPAEQYRQHHVPETEFEAAEDLRKNGDPAAAEAALVREIAKTELDDRKHEWGVAPAPYLALAKLYRSQKRYQHEVSVLERYEAQRKAPGALPAQLAVRLARARELAAKTASKS